MALGLRNFWKSTKGAGLRHRLLTLKWELRYAWQRAWRGYDDTFVFNADSVFLTLLPEVLADYKKNNNACFVTGWDEKTKSPLVLSFEETNAIIAKTRDTLIKAGEEYYFDLGEKTGEHIDFKEQYRLQEENWNKAMDLIKKWGRAFWY